MASVYSIAAETKTMCIPTDLFFVFQTLGSVSSMVKTRGCRWQVQLP